AGAAPPGRRRRTRAPGRRRVPTYRDRRPPYLRRPAPDHAGNCGTKMNRSLRIALVVHGRFHVFDLARELLRRGHDVTLFTNYPKSVVARCGVPPNWVRSFVAEGAATRVLGRLFPQGLNGRVQRWCDGTFGRWAGWQVGRQSWDVVASMSGVAREAFQA